MGMLTPRIVTATTHSWKCTITALFPTNQWENCHLSALLLSCDTCLVNGVLSDIGLYSYFSFLFFTVSKAKSIFYLIHLTCTLVFFKNLITKCTSLFQLSAKITGISTTTLGILPLGDTWCLSCWYYQMLFFQSNRILVQRPEPCTNAFISAIP